MQEMHWPPGGTPTATLTVPTQIGSGRFQIEKFSLLGQKKGEFVSSGPIIDAGGAKFAITVYPQGDEKSRANYVSAFLRLVGGKDTVRAMFSLSAVNEMGNQIRGEEVKDSRDFSSKKATWSPSLGWLDFVHRDHVTNTVIFEASVEVVGEPVLSATSCMPYVQAASSRLNPSVPATGSDSLAADWRALWVSGLRSDVLLRAGGREIKAHGLVLAARSAVFEKMLFSSGMAEAKTGVVEVSDVSHEVLRRLCEFAYTGEVEGEEAWQDDEELCGLLNAAVKYEVSGLAGLCAERAMTKVSVENAAEWLMLATRVDAEGLKAHCVQFVTAHLAEVQDTAGWDRLMQDKQLVCELAPVLFQAVRPSKRRRTRDGGCTATTSSG